MSSTNWELVTVREVTNRVTKGTTPTTLGSRFKTEGINFIKVEAISESGTLIQSKLAYIDEETHEKLARSVIESGDLLFSIAGTIGRVARVHDTNLPANTNQAVAIIRPNLGRIDRDFLYYCLRDVHRVARARTRVVQSVQQNLSLAEVGNIELPLPPIDEQRAIAATLGALDDKIESNRRASQLSQELLRARFRAWFTDYLPWGGQRPADWREGKLRDVVDLVRTPTKPGSHPELPYVPIDTIPMDSLGLSHSRDNSEAKSSLLTFEADDILLGAMRVYFHRVALAPYAGITRNTTFVLRPKSRSHLAFALLTLDDDATIAHADATSKGSTMPYAVWDGALAEMPLFIPPEETIERFENECAPLVELVRDQMFQSTKLQALRDALLPHLLSGRINVRPKEGAA